jgi:hypothetical protein
VKKKNEIRKMQVNTEKSQALMNSSTRLTFLALLAVTAATARAGWAPVYFRFWQPAPQSITSIAQPPAGQAPRFLAIRNVTVIPGAGAPPLDNATVIIRDDRIAAIGPAAETVIPAGARSIEGAGKFLAPSRSSRDA